MNRKRAEYELSNTLFEALPNAMALTEMLTCFSPEKMGSVPDSEHIRQVGMMLRVELSRIDKATDAWNDACGEDRKGVEA